MKTPEMFLASALVAAVAGVVAALAVNALHGGAPRTDSDARPTALSVPQSSGAPAAVSERDLNELRMENTALKERVGALETHLAEVLSTRSPVAAAPRAVEAQQQLVDDGTPQTAMVGAPDVSPEFVTSVGKALDEIRAKEEAEREQKRKELQAQRIEERVTKLQQDLGLTGRQATDMRTALITADDQREALFASMRDDPAGPMDGRTDMRESMRKIHDDTRTQIQSFLTPEQFESYKASEEAEFGGRRGFGDFGGGRPPDGTDPREQRRRNANNNPR